MPSKPSDRTQYMISCTCGTAVSLDARSFGKPQYCRSCKATFTVGWGKDPRTQKPAPVAITVARRKATPLTLACSCGYSCAVPVAEATKPTRCPGCGKWMIVEKTASPETRTGTRIVKLTDPAPYVPASASAAPEKPVRTVKLSPGALAFDCICGERLLVRSTSFGQIMICPICDRHVRIEEKAAPSDPTPSPLLSRSTPSLNCECGQVLEASKALHGEPYSCPACGRSVRMEKTRSAQARNTVIRPVFGPKTPVPPPAAPPAAELPPPPPEEEEEAVSFTEEVEDAAPVRPSPPGLQDVFCPCGEALLVGPEDAGKNIQCPTCLTLIAVELVNDHATKTTGLRVKQIGRMDQGTWSLNDFR